MYRNNGIFEPLRYYFNPYKTCFKKVKPFAVYRVGGLVAQAVRRSPPTAEVPSSRVGPSM